MNFLNSYMQMNVTSMSYWGARAYMWESNGMNICIRKSYPAPSQYSNWNMCVRSGAEYLAADRDFGLGYMTMQKSNWKRLGGDLYKMLVYSAQMETNCNLNQRYEPRYNATDAQVKQCVTDTAYMFYWAKQSVLQMSQNDWMNVFLDMSRATASAEKMDTSCKFQRRWVRRSRLTADEGKVYDFESVDLSDIAKPPQELNLTEERKLVAY